MVKYHDNLKCRAQASYVPVCSVITTDQHFQYMLYSSHEVIYWWTFRWIGYAQSTQIIISNSFLNSYVVIIITRTARSPDHSIFNFLKSFQLVFLIDALSFTTQQCEEI